MARRVRKPEGFTWPLGRLRERLHIAHHRILHHMGTEERRTVSLGVVSDALDALEDVLQQHPVGVRPRPHRGRASSSTRPRMAG